MPSSFQRLTRSLRFQLAFWNAGVLVVLVACLLVVLYLGMRFLLQRELEEVLLEDCRELEQLVASNPDPVELRQELARPSLAVRHPRGDGWGNARGGPSRFR
jgi:hypothetical protein